MKNISILLLGYCAFLLFNSFNIQINGWLAPEIASKKINPVASNEKSLKLGKKIYNKMCWSCHGSNGAGDGPAGVSLNPKPADLSSSTFQQQTDGAIFWKINTGRGTMASFENSLSEEQRWAVINYLRTFKK